MLAADGIRPITASRSSTVTGGTRVRTGRRGCHLAPPVAGRELWVLGEIGRVASRALAMLAASSRPMTSPAAAWRASAMISQLGAVRDPAMLVANRGSVASSGRPQDLPQSTAHSRSFWMPMKT